MIDVNRLTGLVGPDSEDTRSWQLRDRRFASKATPIPRVTVQDILRIRAQGHPNCVGEGSCGRYHGITGFDASGVQTWRDAQLRDTGKFNPLDGTYLEFAVESMIRRGLSPYVPGEENVVPPSHEHWTEGHEAHDRRQLGMEHFRIDPDDTDAIYEALASGMAVFDGGCVTAKFMARGPGQANTPADLNELGGDANGHAQGVAGYWLDATLAGVSVGNLLLYQGSWGDAFAGCYVPVLGPEGTILSMRWQPGCFWAKERTIAARWDWHAFRPTV
jgi:hypothetical protein